MFLSVATHRWAAVLAFTAVASMAQAQTLLDTRASSLWVYDLSTRTVMIEQNADVALPPASMSKLMTLYVLFEALEDGRIRMDDRLPISEYAATRGGSTMFLDQRDRPTVEELIQGIVVQSGNDSSIAVAESFAGSEAAFAEMMNSRAKAVGLEQSSFANSTGWPDPQHRMSMRDLGWLAVRLYEDFPQHYHYFAQERFEFDGRAPTNHANRNPLLQFRLGADGLKTGHTDESGYGMVGSAERNGRRVFFAFSGTDSHAARADEGRRLIDWALYQHQARTVVQGGVVLAEAPVWFGEQKTVGLTVAEDVLVILPTSFDGPIEAEIRYTAPLETPVVSGQTVGDLYVTFDGLPDQTVPLIAASDVGGGGFMVRVEGAAYVLFNRLMSYAVEVSTSE